MSVLVGPQHTAMSRVMLGCRRTLDQEYVTVMGLQD